MVDELDPLTWNMVEINNIGGTPVIWFPAAKVLICHPHYTPDRQMLEANVVINLDGRIVKYRHGEVTHAG